MNEHMPAPKLTPDFCHHESVRHPSTESHPEGNPISQPATRTNGKNNAVPIPVAIMSAVIGFS
jgi:hypothetical protein